MSVRLMNGGEEGGKPFLYSYWKVLICQTLVGRTNREGLRMRVRLHLKVM